MGAINEPSPGVLENALTFMSMCYLRHRKIEVSGGTLDRRTPEELARGERSITMRPMPTEEGGGTA